MGFFYIDCPKTNLEREINSSYWRFFHEITDNTQEVFANDLPAEMSNSFRGYGSLNQFNSNYHYFKVKKGTPDNVGSETHRYRTQIIAAYLEREFDKDFEIHHIDKQKDSFGKYDDTRVIIIYGDSKSEVKNIHQSFHNWPVNMSSRIRGEIR